MQISNIQKMLDDMEHGVYDLTDNGKCIQCGSCCSNRLPMTPHEIKTISEYIKKNNIKECKRLFPTTTPLLDLTCPFLDTTKKCEKCRIYEVRPQVCRDFICNPQKMKPPDMDKYKDAEIVFVREKFFGKEK